MKAFLRVSARILLFFGLFIPGFWVISLGFFGYMQSTSAWRIVLGYAAYIVWLVFSFFIARTLTWPRH